MWVVQWLLQGALVAALATVAIRLVPSTSPRLRHQLWWLALGTVLVLPWLAPLLAPQAVATLPAARALSVDVAPPPAWLWDATVAAWTCSVLLACASLASELGALQLLKRVSRPLALRDAPMSEALYRSVPAVRNARLAVSDEVTGACAVGFFAPRIILSSRLLPGLDAASLDMIVRHELAHLERFDDWLRLLQRSVVAVAGLHPAVRWISHQIDIEREAACDRLVVDRVGGELLYARALTAVAELTAAVRQGVPHLAPGASIGAGGLQARVERILRQPRTTPGLLRAMSAGSVAVLALAVTFVAGLPPLVTVTALEPALRVLASLPASRAFMPQVPRLESHALRVAEPPAPADRGTQPEQPLTEPAPASGEAGPVPAADDTLAAPPTALADTLDVPERHDMSRALADAALAAQPRALPGGVGARAARAGTAAGTSAARAGSAVGRFFTRGGRSVADRF